jgi:anti-sigma factor RsiW
MKQNETVHDANPVGEQLMAYLDGELDPAGSRGIEEKLSSNPELRRQMKELQQTWDMLDDLPRDPVEDDFTRVTVEMVALHAVGAADARTRRLASWRTICLVLGVFAALVAGIAGYSVSFWRLDADNRELLGDLPVLRQLDAYRSAESVEFLHMLEREGLFQGDESDGN